MITELLLQACSGWSFWTALLAIIVICCMDLRDGGDIWYMMLYYPHSVKARIIGGIMFVVFIACCAMPMFSADDICVQDWKLLLFRVIVLLGAGIIFKVLCIMALVFIYIVILKYPKKF